MYHGPNSTRLDCTLGTDFQPTPNSANISRYTGARKAWIFRRSSRRARWGNRLSAQHVLRGALGEARKTLEKWQEDCNWSRPRSAVGCLNPTGFSHRKVMDKMATESQRSTPKGSAQRWPRFETQFIVNATDTEALNRLDLKCIYFR